MSELKLEVGKKYKNGLDKIFTIYGYHPKGYYCGFDGVNDYEFTDDGRMFDAELEVSNLVSEYTEPKKLSGWVNVYRNGISNSYDSFERASADWKIFSNECIACIDLSVYFEGHGL